MTLTADQISGERRQPILTRNYIVCELKKTTNTISLQDVEEFVR
jgi:hypothetical protein